MEACEQTLKLTIMKHAEGDMYVGILWHQATVLLMQVDKASQTNLG